MNTENWNLLTVEYFIVTPIKGNFCNSAVTFNRLLSSDADIQITEEHLSYKKLSVQYELQVGEVEEQSQRFFHIRLRCNEVSRIDEFVSLLRSVRTMAYKTEGKLFVLWDDISLFYASRAYPIIHELENLMRKLITKFMFTRLGMDWGDTAIPKELRATVERSRRKQNSVVGILHETDFIHLANVLFDEYQIPFDGEKLLYRRLKSIDRLEDLDLSQMQSLIPRSNWSRYFSQVVDCDDDYLSKRWKRLYELRNLVAHNNSLNKQEFDEINQLASEIRQPIESAINKIDNIVVPADERDSLAESIAVSRSALYGEFIQYWKIVESELDRLLNEKTNNKKSRFRGVKIASIELRDIGIIDESIYAPLKKLIYVRNTVVHETEIPFSDEELRDMIRELKVIAEKLQSI
ncbi:MAG: hypothetical protein AAGF95_11935 [Chloroflexota bacterium]